MSNPDLERLGLQQDMPDVPPPWVDASDLLLQAERLTLSPPAASGGVRTLQDLVCTFLARHLHTLALLDDLPEHLASTVRASIRRDRSLLSDDGLGVWLDAVLETGDTRQLSLRWAQGLTDSGLGQLRSRGEWASTLVALDLGYCESISDEGVVLLCAQPRAPRMCTARAPAHARCMCAACALHAHSTRPACTGARSSARSARCRCAAACGAATAPRPRSVDTARRSPPSTSSC